jgi:Fe-S-cluster containining protein
MSCRKRGAARAIDFIPVAGLTSSMKLEVIAPAPPDAQPWYADGLRFTCTQCGNCCTGGPGYVWISRTEIDRLAAHLNLTSQEVVHKYCRRLGGRYSLNERRNAQGNYDCVFLKEEKVTSGQGPDAVVHTRRTCQIYHVRPLQCRTWPFWDGLLQSPQHWDRASRRCPGMNTGKQYTRDQIESLRDATDWPQHSPGSAPNKNRDDLPPR